MALSLTPEQRKLRARAAAYSMHAAGKTNTRPAFAARMAKLEAEVDPDGRLAPDERKRRAHQLLKARMAALALKASRARSRKGKGAS